jgi:hypothetical protein
MATAAIHTPSHDGDQRNYHTHIMLAERQIGADGFSRTKDRRFSDFASREETLDGLKGKWAELCARQLERQGLTIEAERWRHGHKTLAEQRAAALARGDTAYAKECAREPTKHLGPVATEIERDGRASHRGNENRAIEADNAERQQIKAGLASIDSQRAALEQEPPPLALALRRLEVYGERKAAWQANPTRDYTALRETHAQVAEALQRGHAPQTATAEAPDKTAANSPPPLDVVDRAERVRRALLREELERERERGGRER